MTIEPIAAALPAALSTPAAFVPDTSNPSGAPTITPIPGAPTDPINLFDGLVRAFREGDKVFAAAQTAEDNVVAGNGDIQTMIFERARADAMLQIASGAASHLTQSLNTLLQMQI